MITPPAQYEDSQQQRLKPCNTLRTSAHPSLRWLRDNSLPLLLVSNQLEERLTKKPVLYGSSIVVFVRVFVSTPGV